MAYCVLCHDEVADLHFHNEHRHFQYIFICGRCGKETKGNWNNDFYQRCNDCLQKDHFEKMRKEYGLTMEEL